jgi:hypothetical protein
MNFYHFSNSIFTSFLSPDRESKFSLKFRLKIVAKIIQKIISLHFLIFSAEKIAIYLYISDIIFAKLFRKFLKTRFFQRKKNNV